MGTRHFTGVILNGQYKIAQYGQFDGYPEGQGRVVLDFLSNADMRMFEYKLKNCKFVDRNTVRRCYIAAGDSPENNTGFVDHETAERFEEMWPSLSRNTGAEILYLVYESANDVPLQDSHDFLNDDLFCQFAYVINLDEGVLYCYANGKNLFAEYPLEKLPTVNEMLMDYDMYEYLKNK